MYHIKEDMRAHKSANLICTGLADMLESKSYDYISITDVCNAVGVSRSTFYRLFDVMDDVLLYQFDTLFEQTMIECAKCEINQPYPRMVLELSMTNKSLTTSLIKSGRYDIFNFSTRKKEKRLAQKNGLQISEKDYKYLTPMLNHILFSVLNTWIEEGYKEDVEQLYQILISELKIINNYL